jgi:uncharacterized membrane protein
MQLNSTKEVIEELKNYNYIVNDSIFLSSNRKIPWFVSGLVGFSAWLATIFVLAFIFGIFHAVLFKSPFGIMFIGIILCGIAIALNKSDNKNIFLNQLSLAICITGEIMIIIGTGIKYESVLFSSIITILIQIIMMIIFKNNIHRFLSNSVIVIALLILLKDINAILLVNILVFFIGLAVIKIWSNQANIICSNYAELFNPISYGLTIAFLMIFIITLNKEMNYFLKFNNWYPSTILISLLLLYFEHQILYNIYKSIQNKISISIFIFTILLAIATLKSPGITASLLVILIAFNYRNIIMLGIATLFLIFYIIFYYYNLDITLLAKSQILISTGILFLLMKFSINKFGREMI